MSNSRYIFPMYVDPNAPVFDNESREDPSYDEQKLITVFPNEGDRLCFTTNWITRAVVAERRLSLDSLPAILRAKIRRIGWYAFANAPDTTVTMNRSIVREYYAILQTGHLFGRTAGMSNTLRGVDVRLDADWINTHYGIPTVSADEDLFMYGSNPQLRDERGDLMYDMADVFGGTHLWPPNERHTGGVVESIPGSYPAEWVCVMLKFLANRVHGTVHHVQPSLYLYLLAYAFLRKKVNVGKYILEKVQKISRGVHGDGYAYFPFLITAFARHFHVPEYDTDDIVMTTSTLVYEEHPWFT